MNDKNDSQQNNLPSQSGLEEDTLHRASRRSFLRDRKTGHIPGPEAAHGAVATDRTMDVRHTEPSEPAKRTRHTAGWAIRLAIRLLIAAVGMCIVALAGVLCLPFALFTPRNRQPELRPRHKVINHGRNAAPAVPQGKPSLW